MPTSTTRGVPDFRGSQTSIRRRRQSITEEHPKPAVFGAHDLLLDPLYTPQQLQVGNHQASPIYNVRLILEAHPEETPLIYTEMLALDTPEDGEMHWSQVARWIKYEQAVEGCGTRFSKPQITLLSILGLLQLKNCLKNGVIILDIEARNFSDVVEIITAAWVERDHVDQSLLIGLKAILNTEKHHLIGNSLRIGRVDTKLDISKEDVEEDGSEKDENGEPLPGSKKEIKKLPLGTEAAVVLTGHARCLEHPISAFVRLNEAKVMFPDVPNIPLPVRFVYVLLSPRDHTPNESVGIGRTMGALFSDEIFRKVAVNSFEPYTIVDAMDEFIAQVVAIPPGNCTTETRWEPHEGSELEIRSVGMLYANYDDHLDEEETKVEERQPHSDIVRTGKLFGGLIQDIKQKAPFYRSDFTDFFRGRLSQSIAACIFLFFANVTSIITFGAVMERALHREVAAIENILCGGISGVIFALLAGQPLNILSATGPTLVFETILYDFCRSYGWDFLPFRFWVGMWIAVILLILVATDMSALVGLITRFTEDAFATLISVVFIIQSFEKLVEISHDAPIMPDTQSVLESPCICHLNESDPTTGKWLATELTHITPTECTHRGGEPIGLQCKFKPDVYMLSILLTFGTFAICYGLNLFRRTPFLAAVARNSISDFGVFIAIVVMTAISHSIGLDVPVLDIPSSFRPTLSRSWLIDPIDIGGWYVALIAVFPAMFYTILIVMDQQITAVIINRKDNKLRKGHGYHLDLLVIAILVVICSALGLPFYVAATVLSVMHVDSLRLQSDTSAPGEKALFLGIKEQRLTAAIAHLMIGLVVFLTPVVKLVPLPVLIGVFLYMGVVSMLGLQFVQRIAMLFMPIKYQPDYNWLRTVRMKRVHLFTFMQILSILALFAVKYAKLISMMFPLMLVFMVILRMFILGRIFTKEELAALDDVVPSFRSVMRPSAPKDANVTHGEELEVLTKPDGTRNGIKDAP